MLNNSGSYGGTTSGGIETPKLLQECLSAIRHNNEEATALCSRVGSLADRLVGIEPPAPGNAGTSVGKSGCMTEEIAGACGTTYTMLQSIARQIDRLERL